MINETLIERVNAIISPPYTLCVGDFGDCVVLCAPLYDSDGCVDGHIESETIRRVGDLREALYDEDLTAGQWHALEPLFNERLIEDEYEDDLTF